MSITSSNRTEFKNIDGVKVVRTVYRVNEIPSPVAKPSISAWASKPTLKQEVNQVKTVVKTEVLPTVSISSPPSPTTPRPGFLEPLSTTFSTQLEARMEADMKLRVAKYWNWQMDQPGFWEERIEQLEKHREKYNIKGGWAANDVAAADAIDEELTYCFNELQQLKEDLVYSEDDADIDETI